MTDEPMESVDPSEPFNPADLAPNVMEPATTPTWPPERSYRLAQDDDGHWYVILTPKLEEFNQWVSFTQSETDEEWGGFDFDACRIPGPVENVIFTGYWIEP